MSQRPPSSKAPARTGGSSSSKKKSQLTPEQQALLDERRREKEAAASRSLRISLISIGAFVVIGGTTGFLLWQSSARAEEARQALAKHRAELRAELLADGSLAPEKAPGLVKRIEATRTEWQQMPDAEAIGAQLERARTVVANTTAQQSVAADLAAMQKEFETPNRTPEAWQQLHDRLTKMRASVPKTALDLQQQLDGVAARIEVGHFEALVAKAAGADPKAALTTLTAAIDLAQDAHDANKDRSVQQAWQGRLRAVAPQLDAAQKAVFVDAAITAVPAQDLTAKEADWVTSTASNMTRHLAGDTLTLACPGGEKAKSGLVVLRHHDWHACQLSFDAKLEQGKVSLLPRTLTQFGDKGTGALVLSTKEAPGAVVVPAGQEVHVDVTVIGDQVVATVDKGAPQKVELSVGNAERRGSFAAVAHPDTKVALRHFRIRKLS